MPDFQQNYVELPNKLKLAVRRLGNAKLGSCVLLHGLADNGHIWDRFAESICSSWEVILLDLRGHGDSDWDEKKEYSISAYVSDVRAVLCELCLPSYILIGHSLGGDIAAVLSSENPPGLVGTILIEAGPITESSSLSSLYEQLNNRHQTYPSVDQYVQSLLETQGLADPIILAEFGQHSLRKTETGYVPRVDPEVAKILLCEISFEWWALLLKKCRFPVLIVRGVGSALLSRATCERLLKLLNAGQFCTIQRAGHCIMTDNITGLCEVAEPFIRKCIEKYI